MGLTIDDTIMTSDQSPHTAQQLPGSPHEWKVSWLPGRTVDRDTAITAVMPADIAATGDIHPEHRLWPAVQSWSAELGLTGADAVNQESQPPPDTTRQPELPGPRAGRLERDLDREAAD